MLLLLVVVIVLFFLCLSISQNEKEFHYVRLLDKWSMLLKILIIRYFLTS